MSKIVTAYGHDAFDRAQREPLRGKGLAEVVFVCGSLKDPRAFGRDDKGNQLYRDFPCTESTSATLYQEFYYGFTLPEGWKIDLEGGKGLVRCPKHVGELD